METFVNLKRDFQDSTVFKWYLPKSKLKYMHIVNILRRESSISHIKSKFGYYQYFELVLQHIMPWLQLTHMLKDSLKLEKSTLESKNLTYAPSIGNNLKSLW